MKLLDIRELLSGELFETYDWYNERMRISIVTLFPDMITGFLNESILKRAQAKNLVSVECIQLRDFATDENGTVDDRPYGGGAGMVLKTEPILKAITHVKKRSKSKQNLTVLTSARGAVYNQKTARRYAKLDHLILVAGHYEGIDERTLDFIDEEVSIGDYVLTGGEIPSAVIVDSVVRLLPNVLKKEEATEEESFFEVSVLELQAIVGSHYIINSLIKNSVKNIQLLEYPQYTRPENVEGKKIPEVLLCGNHEEIRKWRLKMAFEKTIEQRPDLLYI